jgi:hypothetical protein
MSVKARRILPLLNDPKHRNHLVGQVNLLDQDEPAQVGKDQEIKALSEMNELQESENDVWSPGRE